MEAPETPREPRDRTWPLVLAALVAVGGVLAGYSAYFRRSTSASEPVPELELQSLQGVPLRLADLRGQPVVLDFWATWCEPCRLSMPVVQKVTSDLGITTIAVNRDEDELGRPQRIKAFLEDLHLDRIRVVLDDGRAARAFRIYALPTLVVLDPAGRIVRSHTGALEEPELRALLAPVAR